MRYYISHPEPNLFIMKALSYILSAILISFLCFSCSSKDISEGGITLPDHAPEVKVIETEIMDLINAYRSEHGLIPLQSLSIIKSVASTHTDYMIENNQISHDNFFKRKTTLEKEVGAKIVSENVAYAYVTASQVVNAWINSEGHRANIEGDYTNFDISAAPDSAGKWYFTNIFIKR